MSRPRRVSPAAVALELLDEQERPVADRLLAEDPLFRAEVNRLRATTAALGDLPAAAWRPEAPPPLADRPSPAQRSRRRRARRLPALAAAAAAAGAAVLAIALHQSGPEPTTVALHALGAVPGRASLTIAGDAVELRGAGMPPSGPRDHYEAWLADRRGRMVSMGTFRVRRDGRVDAHMTLHVDLKRYAAVDVSLEPDDGNPAHSARSVMRAAL